MQPLKFKFEEVRKALLEFHGWVSHAAEALGCGWATVRNYIHRYPQLEEALEEAKETLIDKAESKLVDLIEKDEPSAIFFFLKYQTKHRGYVERQELIKSGILKVKIELAEEQKTKTSRRGLKTFLRKARNPTPYGN